MKIPIENVFYLLCYAWNRLEEGRVVEAGAVNSPDLPNLLTRVLVSGTRHVLRRGLDRGYETFTEDTRRPRGRIIPSESARRLLRCRREVCCEYDEFNPNTLPNRILRSTFLELIRRQELDRGLARDSAEMVRGLAGASVIPLTAGTFRRVQLHSNNSYYDLLIRVCELTWWSWLPTTAGKGGRFRSFIEDEGRMAQVFEAFVRNFYRREQRRFRVRAEEFCWDVGPSADEPTFLPRMKTDITLSDEDRTIVIDTKYYAEALREHRGLWKVRENNLYQMWTYLSQRPVRTAADERAEGVLLYPAVSESFDHRWETRGHRMRACSIDLARPWPEIHGQLLALVA